MSTFSWTLFDILSGKIAYHNYHTHCKYIEWKLSAWFLITVMFIVWVDCSLPNKWWKVSYNIAEFVLCELCVWITMIKFWLSNPFSHNEHILFASISFLIHFILLAKSSFNHLKIVCDTNCGVFLALEKLVE